jgi:hypothetical protein
MSNKRVPNTYVKRIGKAWAQAHEQELRRIQEWDEQEADRKIAKFRSIQQDNDDYSLYMSGIDRPSEGSSWGTSRTATPGCITPTYVFNKEDPSSTAWKDETIIPCVILGRDFRFCRLGADHPGEHESVAGTGQWIAAPPHPQPIIVWASKDVNGKDISYVFNSEDDIKEAIANEKHAVVRAKLVAKTRRAKLEGIRRTLFPDA